MRPFTSPSRRRSRFAAAGGTVIALAALVAMLTLAGSSAASAPTTVGLGTAGAFAVLAHTGVTDTPLTPSTINGNLGNDANIVTTGNPVINGTSYIADGGGVAAGARAALNTAIGDASGRTPDTTVAGGLLSGVLPPGVYALPHAVTANLTGSLTLSGGANDVWIFQATNDLVTAVGSSITFTGGAQACNVFWVVASSATLNGASFAGTVLASTSVTIGSGVTVNGRVMAYTGDVTLIGDTINKPTCSSSPTPAPTPTPAPAPNRALYCDAAGKTYDLVVGEDKLPPYDALNLVPAYVDPVTGSASCNFPSTVSTPATTTTTAATPPPPATTTTSTPPPVTTTTSAYKPPPVHKKTAAVKAAKRVRVAHVAPQPARRQSGFTG